MSFARYWNDFLNIQDPSLFKDFNGLIDKLTLTSLESLSRDSPSLHIKYFFSRFSWEINDKIFDISLSNECVSSEFLQFYRYFMDIIASKFTH